MSPAPPRMHTDREFEAELQTLRVQILEMAGRVEAMVASALQALETDDVDLARQTILKDRQVNQAEVDADEHCLRVLARWQPMASDLRLLLFLLKSVTDLERIGDLAVNICERVVELHGERPGASQGQLPAMGLVAREMLRDVIQAFVDGDAAAARRVMDRDDELDDMYHAAFREQLAACAHGGEADVEACIRLQSIAKYLERMGDHATNLGEQVVFLLRGTNVRHEGKRPG